MFVVRHSAMTDTRRFAAVFATIAAVAALAGGVGGLVLGQSHHAAPTVSPVSEVGATQAPAPAEAAPAAPAPVATAIVTRTVVVKTAAPVASKPTAAKPVKEPKVTEPQSQVAQPAAVAAEPDPTPDPTPAPNYDQPEGPWQKGGMPSSMNGTPDPTVGGATPAEPMPGTLPMHPVSE